MRESRSFGVMFHHFYSEAHPKGQGAISADDLDQMIRYLRKSHQILSPAEYLHKVENKTISDSEICLTFDDALLCQIDVALPVLAANEVEAFFFVYSSVFEGKPDPLEIYRYFRTICFENFEDFYLHFLSTARGLFPDLVKTGLNNFDAVSYLSAFAFYSTQDKQFRYLRNEVLSGSQYGQVMDAMIIEAKFDLLSAAERVYMKDLHLFNLHQEGHVIGLHSHNHPTMLHTKTHDEQALEYKRNLEFVTGALGTQPTSMSHPCGNYSEGTLDILRMLGVTVGFRSNMQVRSARSPLEIPREDHTNVLRAMCE
jgi:peptidoglycan/xylan/chitin deacetylase (PgdA/CDA1 family)